MKLLAIPLSRQKTATKWLVIGYQKTIAKSLVMVIRLAIPLIELLAIPLGYPKSVAKWLVISNQKTIARWLDIPT